MANDRDFLFWMRDRIVYQYGEDPNTDFVQKLGSIARCTDPKQDTPAYAEPSENFKYHLLGQTSLVGARWYIWGRGDTTILRDIADPKIGQLFVDMLNSNRITEEEIRSGKLGMLGS